MTNIREICLYSMFLKEKYIARYIEFYIPKHWYWYDHSGSRSLIPFLSVFKENNFELDPSFTKMYHSKKSNAALT